MKKLIAILSMAFSPFFFKSASEAFSQSGVIFEATQMRSTFKYLDSNQVQDNSYNPIFTAAYGFGYRFADTAGFLLRLNFGMRKAGASMVYDNMNYTWDLRYVDLKFGVGWLFGKAKARPYLSVSSYYALLMQATQTLNNENFDIKKSKSLEFNDFGLVFSGGVQYKANKDISVYSELSYLMGLKNIDANYRENARNRGYGLTLGVSFTLED